MVVDVEQLYKSFGVLADAKDKAKEVSWILIIIAALNLDT